MPSKIKKRPGLVAGRFKLPENPEAPYAPRIHAAGGQSTM